MEKAIASRAVAMIAQIVAIDKVTAEQGIVMYYSGTISVGFICADAVGGRWSCHFNFGFLFRDFPTAKKRTN